MVLTQPHQRGDTESSSGQHPPPPSPRVSHDHPIWAAQVAPRGLNPNPDADDLGDMTKAAGEREAPLPPLPAGGCPPLLENTREESR